MSSNGFLLRQYDPLRDEPAVYDLWQSTLGNIWPVARETFREKTVAPNIYSPGDHYLAEANGNAVGFAATQARTLPGVASNLQPRGELMLVLVHPSYQRQGIGRALMDRAVAR